MNLGAFACIILFSLRTGMIAISDYAWSVFRKIPLITLWVEPLFCSRLVAFRRCWVFFFGKIYLFFVGLADINNLLVVVGLITLWSRIYY